MGVGLNEEQTNITSIFEGNTIVYELVYDRENLIVNNKINV